MPKTVSRWPQFPDPRAPWFGSRGCNPPTAAPIKWWVQSTTATGPYTPFNFGIMLELGYWDDETVFYESVDFPAVGYLTHLDVRMWQEPDPPARSYTLVYQLEIRLLGTLRWVDRQQYTYGDNVLSLHTMQGSFASIDLAYMPDPISLTPRAYQLGPP